MTKRLGFIAAVLMGLMVWGQSAHAGNYIIYFQGRSWGSWQTDKASVTGWTNVTFAFDGNARLNSGVDTTVRSKISTYCTGTNNCVIHCYSAGCLRVLKALSDLGGAPGLLFIEASASAAGGSELAEKSTSGLTKYIAKLIGQQEQIDYDMVPSVARGTWGYVQDDAGATMYHIAGKKDVCKKLLFFKICGGSYLPGTDDGVVAFHSSCGYSSAGSYTYGCSSGKYPWRTYDSGYASCYGADEDHFGMPGLGNYAIDDRTHSTPSWADSTTQSLCSGSGCDDKFVTTSADFSKTTSGTTIATDVSSKTSNTTAVTTGAGTCYGHCGGSASTCWCDSYCSSAGDCCPDYTAAKCNLF